MTAHSRCLGFALTAFVFATICWPAVGSDEHYATESDNLVVFMLIDTTAREISSGVKADRDNLLQVLREVFESPGSELEERCSLNLFEIDDDVTTLDKVKEAIKDINSTPRDTILFYYSGHGAVDPSTG